MANESLLFELIKRAVPAAQGVGNAVGQSAQMLGNLVSNQGGNELGAAGMGAGAGVITPDSLDVLTRLLNPNGAVQQPAGYDQGGAPAPVNYGSSQGLTPSDSILQKEAASALKTQAKEFFLQNPNAAQETLNTMTPGQQPQPGGQQPPQGGQPQGGMAPQQPGMPGQMPPQGAPVTPQSMIQAAGGQPMYQPPQSQPSKMAVLGGTLLASLLGTPNKALIDYGRAENERTKQGELSMATDADTAKALQQAEIVPLSNARKEEIELTNQGLYDRSKVQAEAKYGVKRQEHVDKFIVDAMNPKVSAEAAKVLANVEGGISDIQELNKELYKDKDFLKNLNLPGSKKGQKAFTIVKNLGDIMAKLRTGAAMSKTEEKVYDNLVPPQGVNAILQDPATAAYKIKRLQSMFESIQDRLHPGMKVQRALAQGHSADEIYDYFSGKGQYGNEGGVKEGKTSSGKTHRIHFVGEV